MKPQNLKLIFLFSFFVMITFYTSCQSSHVSNNVSTPISNNDFEIKTGLIAIDYFVDKGGNTHKEIVDYYFICSEGNFFIKLSSCTGIEGKIADYTNNYVRIYAQINDGLWDTNNPSIQSRVGSYVIFNKIEKIGIPVQIEFSDGNANSYIINTKKINFDPVKAIESSSGLYSGGNPKEINITENDFNSLFIKAETLTNSKDLITDNRTMGSCQIKLSFENSEIVKILKDSPETESFKKYLDNFLNE